MNSIHVPEAPLLSKNTIDLRCRQLILPFMLTSKTINSTALDVWCKTISPFIWIWVPARSHTRHPTSCAIFANSTFACLSQVPSVMQASALATPLQTVGVYSSPTGATTPGRTRTVNAASETSQNWNLCRPSLSKRPSAVLVVQWPSGWTFPV